jgi:hypothetical protein
LCEDKTETESNGLGHPLEISLDRDLVPEHTGKPDEGEVEDGDPNHETGGREHLREIGSDERIKPGIVGHGYVSFSGMTGGMLPTDTSRQKRREAR